MAEEKKDTKQKKTSAAGKKAAARPAAPTGKKPAAKKPAAKSGASTGGAGKPKAPAKKPAAKKPTARKPAAKKDSAETKPKAPAKKRAARKAPAKQAAPGRPVVNARARFVRVAPRKARLVADQVRGMPLEDARALLRFSTRSAAQDVRKLIESAAANAEANHDLVADDLLIKDIHVDDGPTLRRYRPRALGRATRINKRTSHIAVALTPED